MIFPDLMVHSIVADCFITACKLHWKTMKISVLSAGDYDARECVCSGESESLGVKSREDEDSRLVRTYDHLHGLI